MKLQFILNGILATEIYPLSFEIDHLRKKARYVLSNAYHYFKFEEVETEGDTYTFEGFQWDDDEW